MSGLFGQFKTDSNLEVSGIAVEFPEAENADGTIPTFYVARMGGNNKAYAKALETASRPYRRQAELGTLKGEIADKIFKEVFASNVIKGWANVLDENRKEIKYSKDAALMLIEALPDLYERLLEEAKLSANFREAALKAEAKN